MLSRLAARASLCSVDLDSSNAGLGVLFAEGFFEGEFLFAVRPVGRAPGELDPRDEGVVVEEVLEAADVLAVARELDRPPH